METKGPALALPLLVWVLALAGCAGTPATGERQYLLPSAGQPAAHPALIVRVRVAGYLDQGGLVLETGPTTLTTARQHRWAEPLGAQLERALAQALPGDPAGTLTVRVTRFQGTADGQARVSGEWHFYGRENDTTGVFDVRRPLQRDGYEELVTRLDAAWAAVAAQIGARMAAGAAPTAR
ncbi:membrane integrity-associated transporter subunit PqiC [Alloalcanivorax sp. C16-1]|uniref:PqiC family protein n=1 Tax=Alloalcanivorax sp. C16-1 TaxID=3390051 RepID=UPI00397104E0